MNFSRRLERWLMITGLLLIAVYVAAQLYRVVMSRAELRRFEQARAEPAQETAIQLPATRDLKFDFSLWSRQRIAAYEQSLTQNVDPPLAVLRIAKVHLEVAVLNGTDELSLTRGVGHIPGTALPGQEGNVGIAGHRDGFFRALKDVAPGDLVELQSRTGTSTYRIDRIVIVKQNDVSVLQPKGVDSLTLVTCYPFYFVGSAPERYIVEASITTSDNSSAPRTSREDVLAVLDTGWKESARLIRSEPTIEDSIPQTQKPNKEKAR